MSCYALKPNKYDWRTLEPKAHTSFSEEYIADHEDLYLTTEFIVDEYNKGHRH